MDKETLTRVIRRFGTPCYVFDEVQFEQNISEFRHALDLFFPANVIAYSFKTNYTPGICRLARSLGCFAEVVSGMELDLAEKLGFQKDSIIFNGPLKSNADIEQALGLGAIVHLDNIEQVETICALDDRTLQASKIGLRVNVDLAEILLAKKLALGGMLPRFGMRETELDVGAEMLQRRGLAVVSLHGHASSSDRASENYGAIVSELLSVRGRYGLDAVRYLDIGGGFFGKIPKEFNAQSVPSFKEYSQCVYEACTRDSWYCRNEPTLVIEPGMSVVADSMIYATEVVSSRSTRDRRILGVDGSFFDIRPTYHTKILPHSLLAAEIANGEERAYTVVGSTCMERDILFEKATLPKVTTGDIIIVRNVGAYCGVLRPDFINYSPPIISVSRDGTLSLFKKRQDFEDFFASFVF